MLKTEKKEIIMKIFRQIMYILYILSNPIVSIATIFRENDANSTICDCAEVRKFYPIFESNLKTIYLNCSCTRSNNNAFNPKSYKGC